ncbi:hypothetical protein GOODEAATRI_025381 [Goodea atripinnis]|uniref:Uncharacterized protein n=1 Tax=Goodea atripinnis TaxID=208336 RepID=A0ABV0PGX8_9TELE
MCRLRITNLYEIESCFNTCWMQQQINCLPLSIITSLLINKKKTIKKLIHSFIFYTTSSIVGHREAGAYLQQSTGERQGTPWTGHQSITGQHTNNHAHTHSHT